MNVSLFVHPNDLLRQERIRRNWRQQDVADHIGTTVISIKRWERGSHQPSLYFREKLCVLFEKIAEELGLVPKRSHLASSLSSKIVEQIENPTLPFLSDSLCLWGLLYPRNPFFTGREEILCSLHEKLCQKQMIALTQSWAISGLGGIGKTQTVIEYAYRYAHDYAAVFWIGAETIESIISSMVTIADLLNLPEKQEQDQEKVMVAVARWLTNHHSWLLIFDNVEDPALVKRFLPPARNGSLLFTSRRQALGLAEQTLNLELMQPQEGIRFLLYRARLLDPTVSLDSLPPTEKVFAQEIIACMDGLPLALDQAGAYIEATQCSLSDYLQLFRSSQLRLLDERDTYVDHSLSVNRTFALSFEQLKQSDVFAVDLLIVCTFLAPEAIPESFFTEGATYLGATFEALAADPFKFHTAIKSLLSYSLIQRDAATKTVTIHRLVQAVLKGQLSEALQGTWAIRVMHAMTQLFPSEEMHIDYWKICEQLLPHAQMCLKLGERWDKDQTLHITLMNHMATYLSRRARYVEAEPLYKQALHISREYKLHFLVAEVHCGLAFLYYELGKYKDAELLYKQVLDLEEQIAGVLYPLITSALNTLALLYWQQGRYEEAKPLYQRALQLLEQELGPECPQLAKPLNNLAILYKEQGRYKEAELLFQRTLQIVELAFGPAHLSVGYPLNNLAELYILQGRYEEAEPLCERALLIRKQVLGSEHPEVAYPLNNLAELYTFQGNYQKAEPLYQQALQIWEQALGSEHADVSYPLHGLGELYAFQGNYQEAELFYQRALQIREQALGSEHPKTCATHTAYKHLLQKMEQVKEAVIVETEILEREKYPLCACGCGHQIDTSKSRGELRRFFSTACKQRFYRNASHQKRNAVIKP